MVPNPSIRKQENEIHPTKTQKKVTIITKKESRREPEVITDEGLRSQPWITPESMDRTTRIASELLALLLLPFSP